MIVLRWKALAAQALAEPRTEEVLGLSGCVAAIEIVVGVGVQEAVSDDGRRDVRGFAEQRLQPVDGPGVAAGLNNLGDGECGVEAARAASEFGARAQEAAGDELDRFLFEVQCGCGEAGECGDEAILHGDAFRFGAGSMAQFQLHGAEAFVVGLLAIALLVWSVGESARKGACRAIMPVLGDERGLGFNPRPSVGGNHSALDYGWTGVLVPAKGGEKTGDRGNKGPGQEESPPRWRAKWRAGESAGRNRRGQFFVLAGYAVRGYIKLEHGGLFTPATKTCRWGPQAGGAHSAADPWTR